MNKFDVSIILNIHREGLHLIPTLRSIKDCILEAEEKDISIELITVFDKSDQATLDIFNSDTITEIVKVKKIEIDVGSLGLARNAGISLAEGEFIWTADADDLISSNAIVQLLSAARAHPNPNTAVFLEFLVAFGESYCVSRYFESKWLTAADFAYQHSYVSRIFLKRSVFSDLQYKDLKLSNGYAYEDWDLNSRLFAAGFDFIIASNTILFYRLRPNSLLKQANLMSTQMIPHSALFEPENFRKINARILNKNIDFNKKRQTNSNSNFTLELLENSLLKKFIKHANSLEPDIDLNKIECAPSFCPEPTSMNHWGFQLEKFYALAGHKEFKDIVLLPWLKVGGGEKYILQILEQIQEFDSSEKILVISGQSSLHHEWINKLPNNAIFIDIFNTFPGLDIHSLDNMLIRGLLALATKCARIHIKSSIFANRFIERFGNLLGDYQILYYRFCDIDIFGTNFLRSNMKDNYILICDNKSIVKSDQLHLNTSAKHEVIYAACNLNSCLLDNRLATYRLLWASRVASQKRPELLQKIADGLSVIHPKLCIDVYGEIEENLALEDLLKHPKIKYCGSFQDFSELPLNQYDALLYTSAYDGLPNIILETMGCGLLVIAPDVGGISEAVIHDETGYLIPNCVQENDLVDAYLNAIQQMYKNWKHTLALSANGKNLISTQHSKASSKKRVLDALKMVANEEHKNVSHTESLEKQIAEQLKINALLHARLLASSSLITELGHELRNSFDAHKRLHEVSLDAERKFHEIYTSRSWRITKPLRSMVRYLKSGYFDSHHRINLYELFRRIGRRLPLPTRLRTKIKKLILK